MESEELDFVQEHKKIPVTLDLTQCDDAVSRQEAIDAFQMFRDYYSNRSNKEWVNRIETVLNQLPPVNPQPKIGHWISGICDNCGYDWGKDAPIASVPNFCPNCGRRMIKPQAKSEEA